MTKCSEEYDVKYAGKENTIRLYSDGEYRCSCNKFGKPKWGYCLHVKSFMDKNIEILGVKRFV